MVTYSRYIRELAEPFPAKYVERKPGGGGGDYVAHHIVEQRLISIFGRPPQIDVLRELYDGERLTGVVLRMRVSANGDGWSVEEAGEADNPQSKTNGARLKDAISDAYKRCAMRLGCGLHLWAQQNYYLDAYMQRELSSDSRAATEPKDKLGAGVEDRSSGGVRSSLDASVGTGQVGAVEAHGNGAEVSRDPGSIPGPEPVPTTHSAEPERQAEDRMSDADEGADSAEQSDLLGSEPGRERPGNDPSGPDAPYSGHRGKPHQWVDAPRDGWSMCAIEGCGKAKRAGDEE